MTWEFVMDHLKALQRLGFCHKHFQSLLFWEINIVTSPHFWIVPHVAFAGTIWCLKLGNIILPCLERPPEVYPVRFGWGHIQLNFFSSADVSQKKHVTSHIIAHHGWAKIPSASTCQLQCILIFTYAMEQFRKWVKVAWLHGENCTRPGKHT